MAQKSRPTTCAAFAATSPAYVAARPASLTCKRLPNHHGDCRTTLHEVKPAKVTRKPAGKAPKGIDVAALLAAIAAGTITASDALSLVAKASRKPARKVTPATTKVVASTKPVVWGCKAVTKTGLTGKVVRVTSDAAELMFADKSRKTFALASLTRI